MAQLKLGAAGVTANEIDISGQVAFQPVGVPAGVIGTAPKGPAFVPITVGNRSDFEAKFGTIGSKHFGPLAVREWLRNAQAVTYLRVLGVGDGLSRQGTGGAYPGSVTNAGFVVGEDQPSGSEGELASNPYANANGEPGRTYFLGCYMSESAGSSFFSDAGIQSGGTAVPIIRGVLMAASGVLLTMSSSLSGQDSSAPSSAQVGSTTALPGVSGSTFGTVVLNDNSVLKQEFVLLLNGHKGTDPQYPNCITASFDVSSDAYFSNILNKDPYKLQETGHYLYAHWDVHPSLASLTGSGLISGSHGADAGGAEYGRTGVESSAFLITSSLARNTGSATVPNFESFEDRFSNAKSPWVVSQKFGGKPADLFRFHAIDAGANVSDLYKISVENITPSSDPANKYGTFTVKIRQWADRDSTVALMNNGESFVVDLNPFSNRYIGKIIGDLNPHYDFDRDEEEQKIVIDGNYPNKSYYVRVEVHPDVANGFVDPTALPMGFRGISHLVTSGSAIFSTLPDNVGGLSYANGGCLSLDTIQRSKLPPLPMRRKVTDNVIGSQAESENNKFYWGAQFEHVENVTTPNASVLKNKSLNNFAKYFPDFSTTVMKATVGDNAGAADTAANGVMDSDRFCNNLFSLEHIQVLTGSGENATADVTKWKDAVYVRNGVIADTNSGTRAFQVKDLRETVNRTYAKFTLLMQGGFDGVNIFNEDEAKLTNTAVSDDMVATSGRLLNNGPNVKAYTKAVDIMKNTTNLDIQLLAIPGIRHPIVTDYATVATEDRFDALYIMDIEQFTEDGTEAANEVRQDDQITSVSNTITSFRDRGVDSSFAAAYFPDVLYSAPDGNNVFVPPSVLVLGALALNDAVGHPWFAPAGFTRGALPSEAQEARTKLKEEDLDVLYNERINPLIAFLGAPGSGTNPKAGLVVWGQKTLQQAASALDRVNVRRLLIEIRRQVREIAQTIIFEPNREATLARFSAAVTPRLQRIQALAGLERFRVIIDSSTTTQVDVENNTVRGKIFVQPTKSIEFVSLDFVVANNLQQVI